MCNCHNCNSLRTAPTERYQRDLDGEGGVLDKKDQQGSVCGGFPDVWDAGLVEKLQQLVQHCHDHVMQLTSDYMITWHDKNPSCAGRGYHYGHKAVLFSGRYPAPPLWILLGGNGN